MIPLPVVFAVVSAIAGASGSYLWQTNKYERLLSDQRNEYLKRDFKALEVAHADTIRLQEKKDEAERKAAIRITAIKRDAAAASAGLVGLSHTADSALRSASDSHSSCIVAATAQRDVLDQCSTRLVEVGAAADLHASDVQTLIDSWPTR